MNSKRIIQMKQGSVQLNKKYVLYWMQQSQRVHFNHALEYAIKIANQNNLPVLVYFGLSANYPEANQRHYQFMLEGLVEVKKILKNFGISFVFKYASPEVGILPLLNDAHTLVMDQGYLKHQKAWRNDVIEYADYNYKHLSIYIVDTDLIVPVHVASQKVEYGAYTIRPKLRKYVHEFRDFGYLSQINQNEEIVLDSDDDLKDLKETMKKLNISNDVQSSVFYRGGYINASQLCSQFIENKANFYLNSNDPGFDYTSKLSMYLHFGQISSLEIYERMTLALEQHQIDGISYDAFVEQLIIRRELAFNYVYYQNGYDQFEHMTENWAYMTMESHDLDFKPYLYSMDQIEHSETHDQYFNAAMDEMRITGYMHNYMRMYWAKKIIEWSPSFKVSYETIKHLNNKYFIDGRDANSYAGIAWCFGKHDRAWTEREIFGKLRYMNANGLIRKFKMQNYINRIDGYKKTFEEGNKA
ncbi:MAG: deoxyribodipyrimidine photolyase [Tenericutes bacterium HGW-Tenericutes-3]|nr:MAG: deoxyribodipyrimidine photolyase [Tenericutes bacterium HGW-Tenericutes-3]